LRHGQPFKADRSHIHHVMIDYMKLSHSQASLLLALINLAVFVTILFFNTRISPLMLGILFIAFSIVLAIVLFIVNRGYHNLKNKQKIRHLINEIHKKH